MTYSQPSPLPKFEFIYSYILKKFFLKRLLIHVVPITIYYYKYNQWNCDKVNSMCFLTAAATIQFDGSQHVTFTHPGNGVSEAELLNFRFRTAQKQGILFSSRDDTSADRLQIYLGELLLLQFHEKI